MFVFTPQRVCHCFWAGFLFGMTPAQVMATMGLRGEAYDKGLFATAATVHDDHPDLPAPPHQIVSEEFGVDEVTARRAIARFHETFPGAKALFPPEEDDDAPVIGEAMHEETPLPFDGPGKSRRRRN